MFLNPVLGPFFARVCVAHTVPTKLILPAITKLALLPGWMILSHLPEQPEGTSKTVDYGAETDNI